MTPTSTSGLDANINGGAGAAGKPGTAVPFRSDIAYVSNAVGKKWQKHPTGPSLGQMSIGLLGNAGLKYANDGKKAK